MNFHRLKVFYLVARLESFSRAAEELYTSQPNISKHVHQLEAELGVSLFHRLGGSIDLTEAGRVVYRYAQQVFDQTAELQRTLAELEGLARGYLRLGASSTPGLYVLPEIIAAFGRHYPGLELSFSIGNSQQVVEEILAGKLDLGFVEGSIWIIRLGVIAKRDQWLSLIHRSDRCDLSLFQLGLRLLDYFLNNDLPILFSFYFSRSV